MERPTFGRYLSAQIIDYIERLEAQIADLSKRLAEQQEKLEVQQRTMDFQSEQYLKAHGGSWGDCKYQTKFDVSCRYVELLERRRVEVEAALRWIQTVNQDLDLRKLNATLLAGMIYELRGKARIALESVKSEKERDTP